MKGKELNSGIRGGLWDRKHSDTMGMAVYLFGWCVHRQTTQRNGVGLVLRGKPMTYDIISQDTGWETWKLRRWMKILQDTGYLAVKYTTFHRMIIRVLKAKKFDPKQLELPAQLVRNVHESSSAECARIPIRNVHESRNDFSLNRKTLGRARGKPRASRAKSARPFPSWELRERELQSELRVGQGPIAS